MWRSGVVLAWHHSLTFFCAFGSRFRCILKAVQKPVQLKSIAPNSSNFFFFPWHSHLQRTGAPNCMHWFFSSTDKNTRSQMIIITCKCAFKQMIKIVHFDQVCRNPINNKCEMTRVLQAQHMTVHVDIMDWRWIAKRDQRRSNKKTTFLIFLIF